MSCLNQLGPISVTDIIRLLEEIIHVADVKPVIRSYQSLDQFAYREGTNTSQGLIKSEHMWLKWLDTGGADCVRVFAFNFSKAFDSVNHFNLFKKLKELLINPYIVNWIINFLFNRQQRVIADGDTTPFLPINRGVPQGTILGPTLFSVMLNDIQASKIG